MTKNAASRSGAWLALALLAVAALYLPVLAYPFVDLDDYYGVLTNPGIRDFSIDGLRFLFLEDQRDFRYFPLAYASFALDYRLFGLDPGGFHATNLLLHLVNTALVFLLVRTLFRDTLAAGISALLFGLHPLQVESVAWVSSRKNVLFLLLFLLSTLAYIEHRRRREESGTGVGSILALTASLLLFLASATAKTTAVTLPAVLLLVDYRLAKRPLPSPFAFLRTHLPSKLLYLPVIALVWAMTQGLARRSPFLRDYAFDSFDWIVVTAHNLSFYLAKAVAPVHLGVFYPLPDDAAPMLPLHFYAFALLAFGGAALWMWSWRRAPRLFFGLGWYLATIFPMAILPFAFSDMPLLAADRYFYQSSIGLFLLVGLGFSALWRQERIPRAALAVALTAVLLTLFATSWQQRQVWRGTIPLYEQTLRHHPSDAFYYRLALEYDFEGRMGMAFGALELAESAGYQVFFARLFGYQMRISDLYRRKGDYAQAARFMERAIASAPNAIEPASTATPLAFRYLAALYDAAGNSAAAARARTRADAAAGVREGFFESFWFALAPDDARAFLEARLREAPQDAFAWHYLGMWFLLGEEPERADEALRRAEELGLARDPSRW